MVVGQGDTHGVLLPPKPTLRRPRAWFPAPFGGEAERLPKECTYCGEGTAGGIYLGANRCPASSRRHWPLSIGLSTMAAASFAYSMGRPIRLGNAASRVSVAAISSGTIAVNPVKNRLGAIASTRMPIDPRSRAMVRHMPAIAALAAV